MRKLIYFVHETLNGFIANAEGQLWEHFPWGATEMAYNNEIFRTADTWVLGHTMYEEIVPWWTAVAEGTLPEDATAITASDEEFAKLLYSMTKIVVSRTLQPEGTLLVIHENPAEELNQLKQRPGKNIMLSCGPDLLAALAQLPGLIDEFYIIIHPVALPTGKPLFGALQGELPLKLIDAKVFEAGCVVIHYQPAS